MVTTQKRLQRQALKLSIAAAAFACFGAVVVAAPMTLAPKASIAGTLAPVIATKLFPLGSGPAITLARADQGEGEDCVRVTKMTGPDGKVYPTMGMVCGGGQ
jgi:hypothetical protein